MVEVGHNKKIFATPKMNPSVMASPIKRLNTKSSSKPNVSVSRKGDQTQTQPQPPTQIHKNSLNRSNLKIKDTEETNNTHTYTNPNSKIILSNASSTYKNTANRTLSNGSHININESIMKIKKTFLANHKPNNFTNYKGIKNINLSPYNINKYNNLSRSIKEHNTTENASHAYKTKGYMSKVLRFELSNLNKIPSKKININTNNINNGNTINNDNNLAIPITIPLTQSGTTTAKKSVKTNSYIPLNLKMSNRNSFHKNTLGDNPKIFSTYSNVMTNESKLKVLDTEQSAAESCMYLNTQNSVDTKVKPFERKTHYNPIKINDQKKKILFMNTSTDAEINIMTQSPSKTYDKDYILNRYGKFIRPDEENEIKNNHGGIYFIGNLVEIKNNNIKHASKSNNSFSNAKNNYCKFSRPGSLSKEKANLNMTNGLINEGNFELDSYDDEAGDYKIKMGDHINYRYEIIGELGRGSFGQAIKCYDHKTKDRVCIKIIKNKKKFTNQALIEIRILEHIKKNDEQGDSNIVNFMEHFVFRGHIVSIIYSILI
jgi:hypothetical protein